MYLSSIDQGMRRLYEGYIAKMCQYEKHIINNHEMRLASQRSANKRHEPTYSYFNYTSNLNCNVQSKCQEFSLAAL